MKNPGPSHRSQTRTHSYVVCQCKEGQSILRPLKLLPAGREHNPTEPITLATLAGKAVSPRYVQKMVARLAAKAGIQKNIHLHTLRHSFATDLYRETSKIRLVQKAVGHSDLSTTMIYTHIVDDELEGALKSFRQSAAALA